MLQLGKILFILLVVLVGIQGDMDTVEAVGTVVLEDMGIAEAVVTIIVAEAAMAIVEVVVTIIVAEAAMGTADLGVGIVGLVVDIVEVGDMATVAVDTVHIVVVAIVVVEVMVEVITVAEEIMENVTIAMFIKILDINRQENQVLTDIHLQTLNANTKRRLYMLQKPNINLRKNALLFFPPVAERSTLKEKELDLRRNVMNLA